MRNVMLTGALLAALTFPTVALADPGHGRQGHEGRGGHHADKMFDGLNLTAEQKSQIKAIRERQREAAKADRKALMEKRKALAELMRSPNANQAQAMALHREIQTIQNRRAEARMAAWFEVRKILTPAQLQKLSEKKQGRKHDGKRGHGKH